MTDTVTPYKTEDTKKMQVRKMFNNIARKYDLLNRMLSFGIDSYWRKAAIRELQIHRPKTILDIACGTGDFSFAALRLYPERITGIDISEEMLEIGRKKCVENNLAHVITFQQGDAESLQFPDHHYDAVIVAFGVRNFENLQAGLQEMHRVLKGGAPICILEFSKPKIFPVKQVFNFYFKTICPLIGRLISKDARAYSYLYESVRNFPEGDAFLAQLRKAGYKNTSSKRLTFGVCSLYTAVK